MNSLRERGHTKLKLTTASFIVHILLIVALILKNQFEPILWASWFASFNTTLGVYATSKTIKDKAIVALKED